MSSFALTLERLCGAVALFLSAVHSAYKLPRLSSEDATACDPVAPVYWLRYRYSLPRRARDPSSRFPFICKVHADVILRLILSDMYRCTEPHLYILVGKELSKCQIALAPV